jgi:hypothetical protein
MPSDNRSAQTSTPEENLLSSLLIAIKKCQSIHDDSSTSLEDAGALMPHIRKLQACRRALRAKVFAVAATDNRYNAAVKAIETINNTNDADVLAHNAKLQFVNNVTQAASAVLDFAIAVGAVV